MGDPLKPVHAGQKFFPSAARENLVSDLLRRMQAQGGAAGAARDTGRNAYDGTVLVENLTGGDRDLFEVVGLSEPIFGPADNLGEFQFRFALKALTPTAASWGKFAVLQEPIASGKIGRAMVQGLTPALVRVVSEFDDYAFANSAAGDQCAHLVSGRTGAAQIVWVADATEPPADPDVRWALVRLSNLAPIEQSYVQCLKVTGLWSSYGVAFNPGSDRFITFVTGYFSYFDKSWTDESATFYIKATHLPATARIGFKAIQVGDYLGYAPTGLELVPGGAGHGEGGSDLAYSGQVIAFPGPEGALLEGTWDLVGGPGIDVDDTDPDEVVVSVDLAETSPALEFDAAGVDGGLGVKADGTKGIERGAGGVAAKLTADMGLQFGGAGGIEVKPDGTRAVSVTADGVGVDVDTAYGLQVSGSKIQVALKAAGGLEFTGGLLDIPVHVDGGLEHREDGRLGIMADTARGLGTDVDGAFVRIGAGMAFSTGAIVPDVGAEVYTVYSAFHGISLDAYGRVRWVWGNTEGQVGPKAP